jgi:hypothetical protein
VINKENEDKENPVPEKKESSFVDVAYMDVQCHLVIKDKDTGETLVNKRG